MFSESIVPPPPRKLRVTSYATSIRVSWTAPEPESKIMVRGYSLGYGKGIADVHSRALGPDVNVFIIEELGMIRFSLFVGQFSSFCAKYLEIKYFQIQF